MFKKPILIGRVLAFTLAYLFNNLSRDTALRLRHLKFRILPSTSSSKARPAGIWEESTDKDDEEYCNVVVIGASFAGYEAARVLAKSLPLIPGPRRWRLVVVEPHSHFHFTWVLPRFCVVGEHEHKAFIPYGGYIGGASHDRLRWVQDRAVGVTRKAVQLQSGEEIPYEYLIVATGSHLTQERREDNGTGNSLPSRVDVDGKEQGIQMLKDMQLKIRDARHLVIVGGGAAGVELATDAKDKYPEKEVVLIHSRDKVMHRFGPALQAAAMQGLEKLHVKVITGDRLVHHDTESEIVALRSGNKIQCDVLINCTGQRPSSQLIADLAPDSILEGGQVNVKRSMQVADEALPNVYACGDVAETGTPNPNARSAMRQGLVAAYNIISAIQGKAPSLEFVPHFVEGLIKLTLGLENSVSWVGDGDTEMLFPGKDKDLALMSKQAWWKMGAKAYEDVPNYYLNTSSQSKQ